MSKLLTTTIEITALDSSYAKNIHMVYSIRGGKEYTFHDVSHREILCTQYAVEQTQQNIFRYVLKVYPFQYTVCAQAAREQYFQYTFNGYVLFSILKID